MRVLAGTLGILILCFHVCGLEEQPPSKEKLDAWIETVIKGENFDEAFDKLAQSWAPPLPVIELRKKKGETFSAAATIRLNRLSDVIRHQNRVQKLLLGILTAESIEYEIEAEMEYGGQKFRNLSRGAYLRDGSKFRLESNLEQAGLKRRILQVSDGKKIYREHSVLDAEGKATSMQVESIDHADAAKRQQIPRNDLETEVTRASNAFDFYAVSEEFLGPKSVDVLKGVERGARSIPTEQATTHIRLTLRAKDGLLLRSEEKGPQSSHDIRYTKVKINEPIDEAVFNYKPPEGAAIKDQSANKPGGQK